MQKLKDFGSYILGSCIFIAILAIPALFIIGGIRLGEILLPWLYLISWLVFFVNLLILLPLCIFKKTRPYAGIGFFFSSFIYGITLWFLGLLLTFALWGAIGVIIGLFIMGVGVVPMAILATLFNGLWGPFGFLIFLVILTFGVRILGTTLAEQENL